MNVYHDHDLEYAQTMEAQLPTVHWLVRVLRWIGISL